MAIDEPSSDPFSELAELAGGFIHEIKNRVSTLGLNLQLLAEDFADPQSQRERRALERSQRLLGECQRLVDVSNDFLRFARVKDLNLTAGSVGNVIGELVDFFTPTARQSNVEIKCYLPTDLPQVKMDREMLKQALLNLLLNAAQAMPEGGELTIQASMRSASATVPHNQVCIDLIDTGRGMTPETLKQIFKPFFSTKPGGHGLGLATTRRIIVAHGGTLHVQSEVGRGTKFTICLPGL
jgi:signal transduction histidine kinase